MSTSPMPHPLSAAPGEFLAFVSHDWLQPLNTLGLAAQCFVDDYEDGCLNPQKVSAFSSECMTLIGRIASGLSAWRLLFEVAGTPRDMDVRRLLPRFIEVCAPRFHTIGVQFELEEPDSEPVQVHALAPSFIPLMFALLGQLHRQFKPLLRQARLTMRLRRQKAGPELVFMLSVQEWAKNDAGKDCADKQTAEALDPLLASGLPEAFAEAGWSCVIEPLAQAGCIRLQLPIEPAI